MSPFNDFGSVLTSFHCVLVSQRVRISGAKNITRFWVGYVEVPIRWNRVQMERAEPSLWNTFVKLFGPCAFDFFGQAKDDVQGRAIAYIFQQNVIPPRLIHGQPLHD